MEPLRWGGGGHTGVNSLFERIISLENLFSAWYEFRRGKRKKQDVREFEFALEDALFGLRDDLRTGRYAHGPYSSFYVRDPKLRHIHKADVRDRLMHQAVFRVLYHEFDPHFIFDSYSCRIGKGTHKGVSRLERFARKATDNFTKTAYALTCDIKKFFDTVDHGVLRGIMQKTIQDDAALRLIGDIIGSFSIVHGKGIPLGNVTSQLFANVYLNELDQYVKHSLCQKYYVRYCDDFVMLHRDPDYLKDSAARARLFLDQNLKLEIHDDTVFVRKINQGIDFLGYVALPHYRVIRTKTKHRIIKKMRVKKEQLRHGFIGTESFNQSLQSYLGVLVHCRSLTIQKQIGRRMLILIHGEDTYSSRQYLEKLTDQFNKKHAQSGGMVELFEASEGSWEQLAAFLTGGGLFSSKKLVVAKGVLEDKDIRDGLTDFLDTHELSVDTTLIVFHAGACDKRLKLVSRLAKEQYSKEFAQPSESEMPDRIQKYAQELHATIEPRASALLGSMIGADVWRARNEVAKLAAAGKNPITEQMVRTMVHAGSQENIWKFVDALSSGDKKTALSLVDAQLEASEAPQQFLGMIIRQTRLLLALHGAEGSDASLASQLKLNPFVVQKTRKQATRFTIARLVATYHALARLDRSLKESRGEPRLLFTILVDSIVR